MFEIDTFLVTLRIFREDGDIQIIGYAKGYPLEKSKLRRGTADENFGKNNTAYLEWSTDGTKIAFSGGGEIRVVDVGGNVATNLTTGFDPSWSQTVPR